MGIMVVAVAWVWKWIDEVDMLVFLRWMSGLVVAGVWPNRFWVYRRGCACLGSGFCSLWVCRRGFGLPLWVCSLWVCCCGLGISLRGSFFFSFLMVVGFACSLDLPQTP